MWYFVVLRSVSEISCCAYPINPLQVLVDDLKDFLLECG